MRLHCPKHFSGKVCNRQNPLIFAMSAGDVPCLPLSIVSLTEHLIKETDSIIENGMHHENMPM